MRWCWRCGRGGGAHEIVLGVGLHPVARVFSHPAGTGVLNRRLFSLSASVCLPPSLSLPPASRWPLPLRTSWCKDCVAHRPAPQPVVQGGGVQRSAWIPFTAFRRSQRRSLRPIYSCDRGRENGDGQAAGMLLPPLKGRVRLELERDRLGDSRRGSGSGSGRLTVMEACSRYGRRHWWPFACVTGLGIGEDGKAGCSERQHRVRTFAGYGMVAATHLETIPPPAC